MNVIHSIDAYLLRTMQRLCNYDRSKTHLAKQILTKYLNGEIQNDLEIIEGKFTDLVEMYQHTQVADISIIRYLTHENVVLLDTEHATRLLAKVTKMLDYKPFPVITVHDAFRTHANNCDMVRYWYKEILADLAESRILNSIMNELGHEDIVYSDPNVANAIRNSSYGLR